MTSAADWQVGRDSGRRQRLHSHFLQSPWQDRCPAFLAS